MNDQPHIPLDLLSALMAPLLEPLREEIAELKRELAEVKASQAPKRRGWAPVPDGYLREGDAAAVMGIHRTTLSEIRKRGEIDHHLLCGHVLYSRADLDAFMQKRRRPARARRLKAVS